MCSQCGSIVPEGSDYCASCGSFFDAVMSHSGTYQSGSAQKEIELENILPGEKILEECSPSRRYYRKIVKTRFLAAIISLSPTFFIGLIGIPWGTAGAFWNLGYFLIAIGLTALFTFLVSLAVVIKYRKEFSARYVITSSKVVTIINNRIKMELPVQEIENAVMVSGTILNGEDSSVFFPRKGYMDLNGVDLNIPMVPRKVADLRRDGHVSVVIKNDSTGDGVNTEDEINRDANDPKYIRKTRKEILERSFLYLTADNAREIAMEYRAFIKNRE